MAKSISTVPFLDEETAAAIGWAPIWQSFAPVTLYGQSAKAVLQPFLPGEETAWRKAATELADDAGKCSPDVLQEAGRILQTCPDIRDALAQLRHTTGAITSRECLALKGFARVGLQLTALLSTTLSGLMQRARWEQLLSSFGDIDSSAFAVAHIAGPTYIEAGQAYAQVMRKRSEIVRELHRQIVLDTGLQPNRDGQLVLLLPQQTTLVKELKSSRRLHWLRDTPFESVFEVVESDALAAATQEVERAEAAMQQAAEAAMKQLSDALRGALPDWNRAVDQITALDLRLAKVRLMQMWSGCVAEEDSYPQFVKAVQPQLDARYQQQGRSYVPLDWAFHHGVNVLAGSNMGGKSFALQLLCVCQCLAQYGLPVPAKRAVTRLYRAVRCSASADTEAQSGLSSFGSEMVRLTGVLELLGNREPVLAVFDEPGRSTNPREGEAIVMGLLQGAKTYLGESLLIVATHFVAVTKLHDIGQYRVRGLGDSTLFADEGLSNKERLLSLADAMDYRIEAVETDVFAEEGLRIAAWLGVPQTLLDAAKAFLNEDSESGKGRDR